MPGKNPKSGLALVIVIIILGVLVALGLPFVLSMLYKSRITRNTFHTTQARALATAARNYAIGTLYQTHDTYEQALRGGTARPPWTDSDYDTPGELIQNTDLAEAKIADIPNPRNFILGVDIQDEQGKINIRTAPDAILRNIKTLLGRGRGVYLKDCLTDYSYVPDDWIEPRQLRGYVNYLLFNGSTTTALYLPAVSGRYAREGARIRITNGNKHFFAYKMPQTICTDCNSVVYYLLKEHSYHITPTMESLIKETVSSKIWHPAEATRYVLLDRTVPDDFLSPFSVVEVASLHPININTAPDEVIRANILNVGWRGYENYYDPIEERWKRRVQDLRISEAQAKTLTERIRDKINTGGGFALPSDYYFLLSQALADQVIITPQMNSLWNNNSGTAQFTDLIGGNFTETLPFCFRSYDKYTVSSSGVINYPNANQSGLVTFREIIDITPPGVNEWRVESQSDFNREFLTPYGNAAKWTTFPNLTSLSSYDVYAQPDRSRAKENGELKLKTVEDSRGNNVLFRDSFPDTQEGKELSGSPLTYESTRVFTFVSNRDVSPGGIEMWVKIQNFTSPTYLFDIKQNEYENRLALWYDGSQLVLSACDATLEQTAAQIRAPLTFKPNTWYHIGAYWKGTKYAQLGLLVDGKPVGNFAHYTSTGQKILTELSAELTGTVDTSRRDGAGLIVPVADAGPFPEKGVIEIGDEAIEYSDKIGSGLRVVQVWTPDPEGGPDTLTYHGRGARGTTPKTHPAGAKVTIYGYANTLRNRINISGYPALTTDRLMPGEGTLSEQLPDHTPMVIIFKPRVTDTDPNTGKTIVLQEDGIDDTTASIPVTKTETCDISEFPNQGYLKIDDEVIYYSGKGTMKVYNENKEQIDVPCFTGCQRGAVGTEAAAHPHNTEVFLYSIRVSDNSKYLDRTIIQLGTEWIGPLQREGTNYFIGIVEGGRPYTLERGLAGTTSATHTDGTSVIPVFAVGSGLSGAGDVVTIIESDQTQPKEERTINQVKFYSNNNLVAFTENVSREYPIDGSVTRLLKFPSDELASYLPENLYIGSNCPRDSETATSFDGLVDEIRFFRTTKGDFRLNGPVSITSPADGEEMTMNNVTGIAVPGLIKVGDEFIGYAKVNTRQKQLLKIKRGYLGSPIQAHDPRERAIHLFFLPVGALTEDISAMDYQITFTTQSTILPDGYLLIDNEVIGYPWRETNRVSMPYDRQEEGLYRGAFGTAPADHQKDTLVFAIPFRYFDRYKKDAFDTTFAYFQCATKLTNAKYKTLRWDDNDSTLAGVRIKMLARFNGKPAWDTPPTNKENGIFEFTNSGAINSFSDIEADQIEILTFIEYLPGAYDSDDWKHSPVIRQIRLEYEKPNLIMTHQEE